MINYKKQFQNLEFENARNKKKFDLLCQWMKLKNNGIRLYDFFDDRGIASAAVYGIGDIGQLLCNELTKASDGFIRYIIDQAQITRYENIDVYRLDKNIPKVDAIIITPVLVTDEIEDRIYETLGEQTTFVFEELLFELSRKNNISSTLWRI